MAHDNDDACHDHGGHPDGPIDRTEHEPSFWEQRVDAIPAAPRDVV